MNKQEIIKAIESFDGISRKELIERIERHTGEELREEREEYDDALTQVCESLGISKGVFTENIDQIHDVISLQNSIEQQERDYSFATYLITLAYNEA